MAQTQTRAANKHRNDIDGLRAFAIVPVLLFHMGVKHIPGGFLGVDVFFVISGFLITGILYRELETTGRFSIKRFYERRFRRIMPALIVVTVATVIAGWFILLPEDFTTLRNSVFWMFGFLSNVFFLNQNGYFSPDIDLNPLLHTWSLAIEEQFYVFFPILLWVLHRFLPKNRWLIPLGILTVVSFGLSQWNLSVNPSASFYLIQFRAWELALGAIAAIYLTNVNPPKWFSNVISFLALAGLTTSFFIFDSHSAHPGFATLLPVISTVLVITFTKPGTIAHKILTFNPIVAIGLISYSLYLWHQPIFAFIRISADQPPTGLELVPGLILSIVLAALTWKFIENPFRDKKVMSSPVSLSIIATASVAVIASTIAIANPMTANITYKIPDSSATQTPSGGTNSDQPSGTVSAAGLQKRMSPNYGLSRACGSFVSNKTTCTYKGAAGDPTVALWGDSFAMHLVQAFENSATKVSFITQTRSICNPVIGYAPKNAVTGMSGARGCNETNATFLNYLLHSHGIQTVILASHWENLLGNGVTTLSTSGTVSSDTSKPRAALQQTIQTLKNAGFKVVVVTSPAYISANTGACVVTKITRGKPLSECNFPLSASGSNRPNELLRSLSTGADRVLNLPDFECPNGTCLATAGSVLIYRDRYHLSREGSAYLGRKYDLMGKALGLS